MKKRRRTFAFGLLVVGLALAIWAGLSLTQPKVPTLPIPDPNGHDDLIRAANSIGGTPPKPITLFARTVGLADAPEAVTLDPSAATWDEAKAFLEANRETLAIARVGLDRECVVPIAYVPGYLFTGSSDRKALLALAEVFLWEARWAIQEGRDADAARSFLDMVRLGHATARGGVESDYWVGNNIAAGGLLGLVRVRDQLDLATSRRVVNVLRELEEAREPYEWCRERERAVQVAEQGRTLNTLARLVHSRQIGQARALLDESVDELIAHSRVVQVDLALRAFEAEKGKSPDNLSRLVPDYLPDLPLDPYTKTPLIFRPVGPRHLLYSVGGNRLDDGGIPVPANRARASVKGDILPDSVSSTLAP